MKHYTLVVDWKRVHCGSVSAYCAHVEIIRVSTTFPKYRSGIGTGR